MAIYQLMHSYTGAEEAIQGWSGKLGNFIRDVHYSDLPIVCELFLGGSGGFPQEILKK